MEYFSIMGAARLSSTYYVLLPGILCYVLGMIMWIYALRSVPLVIAYPFIALSFIAVPLLSSIFLGETYGADTFLGGLLIVAGIIIMNR